jgi:hypothetical protein
MEYMALLQFLGRSGLILIKYWWIGFCEVCNTKLKILIGTFGFGMFFLIFWKLDSFCRNDKLNVRYLIETKNPMNHAPINL